jgi:hypothetical protein
MLFELRWIFGPGVERIEPAYAWEYALPDGGTAVGGRTGAKRVRGQIPAALANRAGDPGFRMAGRQLIR